jgi:ribA/ribD-fused uncharacterized protein
MRETNTHIYFWGTFLSNFIPKTLSIDYMGHKFNTSEQLFMYIKAKFFNDHEKAYEIATKGQEPREAKRMGREVVGYDESIWSKYREDAMYQAVLLKFQSDEKLKQQLLDTGDKILVEGTPMDPIWGVMIKWDDDRILDEKNWRGQNLLGKVLMRVRNDLKNIEI